MHAIIHCTKYDQEKQYMKEELRKTGVQSLTIKRVIPPNGCHFRPQGITYICMIINFKMHFIIKQSVLHIGLSWNYLSC